MAQPTYEYSGVCYTATSGQTTFALTSTAGRPIGYLSPSHIYVRISTDSGETWNSLPVNTGWTFADPATSIVLTTPATVGEWVDIQRKTPIDEDWIDFQAGSLLTAGQLNEAETFSLYCDQEIVDGIRDGDLSPVDPGVTKLIAGANIVLNPTSGVGEVTIESLGGTGGIVYKGTVDATQPAPADPQNGDFWVNTTDGTADVSWTGIGGDAISIGDRLIYDGSVWEVLPTPPAPTSGVTSVNGETGVVVVGVEQLNDFAYYPASQQVTLLGPCVGEAATFSGTEYTSGSNPNLYFVWPKTNTQVYDVLSQLTAGDPVTVCYYSSVGTVYTELETTFENLANNGGTVPSWLVQFGDSVPAAVIGDYPVVFKSPLITNGQRPITTGQTLIYDQTTEKWRPEVPQLKVEQLADFAYYPASNEGTLEGPLVDATGYPTLKGSEYFCGLTGGNAVIWFSKENTQLYDILNTLEVGEALSVFYTTSFSGYGYNLRKDTTFVDLGVLSTNEDNWAFVVSGDWTGITYEGISQAIPGQPDGGPIRFESAFITNGSLPITSGQALIYDQVTETWRPEDIANGLNISALPALP